MKGSVKREKSIRLKKKKYQVLKIGSVKREKNIRLKKKKRDKYQVLKIVFLI